MDKVIIYDFGSQYTQLIARRVRELNVYCEIHPFNKQSQFDNNVKACILAGSPCSVNDLNAPDIELKYFDGIPILGICYGAQLLAHKAGGKVQSSGHREFGKAALELKSADELFHSISSDSQVWMSHSDSITTLPEGFSLIASSNNIPVAAYKKDGEQVYGLQFHPEVTHTKQGSTLISNFLFQIAGCKADWSPDAFVDTQVTEIKNKIGSDEVLMGLSGGVDSTVAATILHEAIGDQLHCFFIDNGLLRQNEFTEVLASYEKLGLNVTGVDAKKAFYDALQGVSDPEQKRKIIGRTFIEVFEREAKKLPNVKWLGQGTIYPDVIESVSVHGPSVTIKSHHNVGGLPERLALQIIEPLRLLFKDEVRNVGRSLSLGESFIGRHPFPGPGLAIRILGDITADKVEILQRADAIFINGLREFGLYDQVWQAATILLPVQSVGVMGDERTYEQVAVLRAVNSVDGMTAEWSRLPQDFLAAMSSRIINQVNGINRVVYDISTKPPATIEWE